MSSLPDSLHKPDNDFKENKLNADNLKVKICGITREKDLKIVEDNGTDLIGFINVKRSPRYVNLEKINNLLNSLRAKNKAVLVLEPENTDEVLIKIKKTSIKNVQLHSLDPDEIKRLKKELKEEIQRNPSENIGINGGIKIIRAIGFSKKLDDDKKSEIESFAAVCDGMLFDSQVKGKSGGTGIQIPRDIVEKAVKIARDVNPHLQIFLAGGMDLNRIKTEGTIIKELFDVVDFNSSLEDAPGIKNELKVKELLQFIKILNLDK